MRNSLLAILIAFGTVAIAMPAIAAEKIERPAAARDQSVQHQQMQEDAGAGTPKQRRQQLAVT